MIQAVVDPGTLISALLTPGGVPARLVTAWERGVFQLVVCPLLLDELTDVLLRPKFRTWVETNEAVKFIEVLRLAAMVVDDPIEIEAICRDPDDDYLIALVKGANANVLVSGDQDLTSLDMTPPVVTPRHFLMTIEALER